MPLGKVLNIPLTERSNYPAFTTDMNGLVGKIFNFNDYGIRNIDGQPVSIVRGDVGDGRFYSLRKEWVEWVAN